MMISERIEVVTGDIASADADAVVNAANERLAGGGGVDGAIHRAAGPLLLEECLRLGGCPTGQARMTKGYDLKARYVIHTVGPVWRGGYRDEHVLLASCYRESLQLASDNRLRKLAFPAISTGAYGFPPDQAAMIALRETMKFLSNHTFPEKVTFVMYSRNDYEIFIKARSDEAAAG